MCGKIAVTVAPLASSAASAAGGTGKVRRFGYRVTDLPFQMLAKSEKTEVCGLPLPCCVAAGVCGGVGAGFLVLMIGAGVAIFCVLICLCGRLSYMEKLSE